MHPIVDYQTTTPGCSPYITEPTQTVKSEKPVLCPPEFITEKIKEISGAVNQLCDTQDNELDELHHVRVKLAKKQFFINIVELTVSLASFAVSVGISICSGGATTPIAVITGLNLMLSVSNLACAYHNWNCASKNKDELTMGSDAMQQAVFMLARYCQASPESAKKIARFTSYFVRVGMVVSLGTLGVIIHPTVYNSLCVLAKNYAPIFSSMLSVITSGALGIWINNHNDEKEVAEEKLTANEKGIIKELAQFDIICDLLTKWNNSTISPEEESLKLS
ncbi:hypothetical protein ABQG65_18375 [Yersinia alsatica]|uniref:hypothetical protein n=1 Tax=Yersinia alsatica TaxID=2890317 RepID=UPI0011A34898|nr:hypothetical protein [Yersinia alsatica]